METLGSPDKRVAPHVVFDLGIGYAPRSLPIRVSGTIVKVCDQRYLYKFESSFGGTQFGVPRTLAVRVDVHV
jgi:hypothetical protein